MWSCHVMPMCLPSRITRDVRDHAMSASITSRVVSSCRVARSDVKRDAVTPLVLTPRAAYVTELDRTRGVVMSGHVTRPKTECGVAMSCCVA